MSVKYSFKLLREQVGKIDSFKKPTHQKIANSLWTLIQNEENGFNIGLMGEWGSGKSTIINLLKENVQQAKEKEKSLDYLFFYFDTWAHEGDPLRRIFLENFINYLKKEYPNLEEKLEEKRQIISGEKKSKNIKVKRITTWLGLYMAISTFVFTIGVSLLSTIKFANITLRYTGSINIPLVIAIIFSLSPFMVLLCNYVQLKKKKKNIRDLKYWAFLQNNSVETITENVFEEERNSVQFEKYFRESLEIIDCSPKKIIVVLDNLDRIEEEKSLKVLSTLQTFIQNRNPVHDNNSKIFDNIFTIIPYDEEGLSKLWDKELNIDGDNSQNKKKLATSFFDKMFQIRIDVPKVIQSNSIDLLSNLVDEAFCNWDKIDKEHIKSVFKVIKKDDLGISNPRQLKIYLNQIGFYRNHCNNEISTKSIAIYVYLRYIEGKSNKEIKYINESNLISKDNKKELLSIIYGVDKNTSEELSVRDIIEGIFKNNVKHEQTSQFIELFPDTFWTYLENNIINIPNSITFIHYSTGLCENFRSKNRIISDSFIETFKRSLNINDSAIYRFNKEFCEGILSMYKLMILNDKQYYTTELMEFYMDVFSKYLDSNMQDAYGDINLLDLFLDTLNLTHNLYPINKSLILENGNLEFWKLIFGNEKFKNISKILIPDSSVIFELSQTISQPEGVDLLGIADLLLDNKVVDINGIKEGIINLISDPLLSRNQNIGIKERVLSVFKKSYFDDIDNKLFHKCFKEERFYFGLTHNYFRNITSDNSNYLKDVALILAIYFKKDILSIKSCVNIDVGYDNHRNQIHKNLLDKVISYWKESDKEKVDYVYQELTKIDKLEIIEDISKDENNLLAISIKRKIEGSSKV